jgi:hypothetical protein
MDGRNRERLDQGVCRETVVDYLADKAAGAWVEVFRRSNRETV